jgi:hypothetical protein
VPEAKSGSRVQQTSLADPLFNQDLRSKCGQVRGIWDVVSFPKAESKRHPTIASHFFDTPLPTPRFTPLHAMSPQVTPKLHIHVNMQHVALADYCRLIADYFVFKERSWLPPRRAEWI